MTENEIEIIHCKQQQQSNLIYRNQIDLNQ